MAQENKNQMNLTISEEVSKGTYSNLVVLTHSPAEFILDFAQALPGTNSPVVRQRIVMAPVHAKRLFMALSENINKYEKQFGTITEPGMSQDAVMFDALPQGKA